MIASTPSSARSLAAGQLHTSFASLQRAADATGDLRRPSTLQGEWHHIARHAAAGIASAAAAAEGAHAVAQVDPAVRYDDIAVRSAIGQAHIALADALRGDVGARTRAARFRIADDTIRSAMAVVAGERSGLAATAVA